MTGYEVLYILPANLDDAAREAEIEKYSELVKSSGGEVESVNKWGVRRLAYPINFKNDGYYVLMTFKADETLPLEMERRMGISDSVMRYLVTKQPAVKANGKKPAKAAVTTVKAEEPKKVEAEVEVKAEEPVAEATAEE